MKANKEVRNWVRRLVKALGKKNGVVRSCWFDSPEMERKIATNKRLKKKRIGIKDEISFYN